VAGDAGYGSERSVLAVARAFGGFEWLEPAVDGFAEYLVGLPEFAPNRPKVRRQRGDAVKHFFVQYPHLVPRVLVEGPHLYPESIQATIYFARMVNEAIHFGFDSVQPFL